MNKQRIDMTKDELAESAPYYALGELARKDFHSEGYDYSQILPLISPEHLSHLREQVHPLIVKPLGMYLAAVKFFRFNVGHNVEGHYLSLDGVDDGGEEMRVTVRHTRRDYTTSEKGVWFWGSDDFDYLPSVAGALKASTPAWDLRKTLKSLEIYGSDDDIDCAHEGTWLQRNDGPGTSAIHDVWRLGGSQVVITIPATKDHLRLASLAHTVCDLSDSQLTVVSGLDWQQGMIRRLEIHSAHVPQGATLEDDAKFVIEQAPHEEQVIAPYATSQTQMVEPMLRYHAEKDDPLGVLSRRLLQYRELWSVFQIILVPDEPTVILRVADSAQNTFYIRLKK